MRSLAPALLPSTAPGTSSRAAALVGVAALAALAAGCSAPPAPEPSAPPPPTTSAPAPATLSCDDLARTLLVVEPTRAALAARFGPPDSLEVATEPNRHVPGQVDSLFVAHYDGLTSAIRTPSPGRDLPFHVVVTDSRFLRYPALGIGATATAVEAALGPPTRRTPTTLVYECGEGAEEPVTFRLRDGVVERIVVDFYVD